MFHVISISQTCFPQNQGEMVSSSSLWKSTLPCWTSPKMAQTCGHCGRRGSWKPWVSVWIRTPSWACPQQLGTKLQATAGGAATVLLMSILMSLDVFHRFFLYFFKCFFLETYVKQHDFWCSHDLILTCLLWEHMVQYVNFALLLHPLKMASFLKSRGQDGNGDGRLWDAMRCPRGDNMLF